MEKIIITNPRGESVTLDRFANPYLLESLDGVGDTGVTNQAQTAPHQDGETAIDTILQTRYITVIASILGSTRESIRVSRANLQHILNPKLGESLIRYEYDGGVKEIYGKAEQMPSFKPGDRLSNWHQRTQLVLRCSNPYWKSVEQVSDPMSAYIGLFEYPVEYPVEYGTQGASQTFTNNGDVDVPVEIEFHGPATNPVVMNETTGAFIKINRDLQEGDILLLNTDPNDLYVMINGENVFNWVDASSILSGFVLVPGDNLISYSADAGQAQGIAKLTWKERYVGV